MVSWMHKALLHALQPSHGRGWCVQVVIMELRESPKHHCWQMLLTSSDLAPGIMDPWLTVCNTPHALCCQDKGCLPRHPERGG